MTVVPVGSKQLSAKPSGELVEKGTIVRLYVNDRDAKDYYEDVNYTLDGSDPKNEATCKDYTYYKGITIDEPCTLRAVGKKWNGSGYDYSSELTETYLVKLNDGDIFTAKTAGDIDMTFKVISAADMTCQVGGYRAVDDNTEGHVKIPETINEFKVVSIGGSAFLGCKGITSVSIPQTVKEFGPNSFNQCTNLESINFPQHLQVIGERAFYHDDKLSCPIVIPEGVSVLEKYAFEYCKSLTSITLPSTLTEIREGVFRECRALESIKVPNGIKSIGEYAFDGCGLVSFDWPDKVTEIPLRCFRSCNNLVSIHIPQTVKSIGKEAFSYSGLQSLDDIPSSVTEIGEGAFFCADLTNVTIPSGITSISKETFGNCTKLSSVTISPSVVTIGEGAFSWSQSLKEVYIPNSVKRIDEKAFFVCTNIKQIYSYIKEPFDINDNVFYSSEYENRMFNIYNKATLYVPNGTKSKYEATSGWKNFKIIVELIPVTNITLPETAAVAVGQRIVLTPEITPADAETTLTWTSDDEGIATVNANGVVTGIAEGLAIITVSTSNGLTSNACKVKVEPDPSGISDVKIDAQTSTSIFSLSGQRLTAPKKGINIVGGKKKIVK